MTFWTGSGTGKGPPGVECVAFGVRRGVVKTRDLPVLSSSVRGVQGSGAEEDTNDAALCCEVHGALARGRDTCGAVVLDFGVSRNADSLGSVVLRFVGVDGLPRVIGARRVRDGARITGDSLGVVIAAPIGRACRGGRAARQENQRC